MLLTVVTGAGPPLLPSDPSFGARTSDAASARCRRPSSASHPARGSGRGWVVGGRVGPMRVVRGATAGFRRVPMCCRTVA